MTARFEASGHTASADRKMRELDAGVHLAFSLYAVSPTFVMVVPSVSLILEIPPDVQASLSPSGF